MKLLFVLCLGTILTELWAQEYFAGHFPDNSVSIMQSLGTDPRLPLNIGKTLTKRKSKKFDEKIKKSKAQQVKLLTPDPVPKKIDEQTTKELHERLNHMIMQTNPEARFIRKKKIADE